MGRRKRDAKLVLVILFMSGSLVFEKSYGSVHNNACNFPAIFNFGDSNSDTGAMAGETNAGFAPPFCVTWLPKSGGCTRGSDGRLTIDFLSEKLGLPYLPGYGTREGKYSRQGISFANWGKTIGHMADTQQGQFLGLVNATMKKQDPNLPKPEDFSKALYTIDIGHNDIVSWFNMVNKTLDEKVAQIPISLDKFTQFIQTIYHAGGRTFWVHNSGPLGCLGGHPPPVDEIGCSKPWNEFCQEFNKRLKEMVLKLREQLKDASLVYVDIYSAKYSLFKDPGKFGIKHARGCCCKSIDPSRFDSCGTVARDKDGKRQALTHCPNPTEYILFDCVHFTEAANKIVANLIMDGSLSDPPLPITQACTKSSSPKSEL